MTEKNNEQKARFSWFFKWFLNNKASVVLLNTLLVLLIILLFSQVSWFFMPVVQFISIVALPIIFAGVLFYLLDPLINFFERRFHVKRVISISVVFIILLGLIIWGIAGLVPILQNQTESIIKGWPDYWKTLQNSVGEWGKNETVNDIRKAFEDLNNDAVKDATAKVTELVKSSIDHVGTFVGTIGNIFIGLITMPFILFFMLKDGKALPKYLVGFLPVKIRKTSLKVLTEMNTQVSQYVRGQLTVAFFVAVMFMVGYSVIGLNYGVTLGFIAGPLNLIPYLGSTLAMIPAIVIAAVTSPVMLLKVILVFAIEQTIESQVVSPLVLGSNMDMHPVTIILVLLATAKMFGLAGVILGIPGYAVLKVIISHVFEWYKSISGLYEEDDFTVKDEDSGGNQPPTESIEINVKDS